MLTHRIKKLAWALMEWLWPSYMKHGNEHALHVVCRHYFIQKILRINASVNWPVHWTTKINSPDNINRGSRTPGLSRGCHIDGRNGIEFGRNVWVGPHAAIISMNHDLYDYSRYIEEDPIKIGNNCWIGAKAIILPGVVLGDRTIIGAGAVVTKSFPDGYQVLAGNPAKIIKTLDS